MSQQLPLYEPDAEATYQLDLVAQLTGIASQTIVHYREHGLIQPVDGSDSFDDEAIHTLRRIEHLRTTCDANLAGLKLILNLMNQVEQLKSELRARH
jgi:DNA-binding transcriptional MerR regulator